MAYADTPRSVHPRVCEEYEPTLTGSIKRMSLRPKTIVMLSKLQFHTGLIKRR